MEMPALSMDQAYDDLSTHVRWAARPWVAFIWAPSSAEARQLRQRCSEGLLPWYDGVEVLRPESPEDLRLADREVLAPETAGRAVWLEATQGSSRPGEEPWLDAWSWLLQRLNERRERLLRHLPGGLVLVMPRDFKPQAAAVAPDLWSIRELSLDLDRDVPAPEWHVTEMQMPHREAPSPQALALALEDVEELERRLAALRTQEPPDPDRLRHLVQRLARARVDAAVRLLDAERWAEARALAEAVRRTPEVSEEPLAQAAFVLAEIHVHDLKYEAAVADYSRAIEQMERLCSSLEPSGQWTPQWQDTLAGAYINRGTARAKQGQLPEAVEDFGHAIELMENSLFERGYGPTIPWLAMAYRNLAGLESSPDRARRFLERLDREVGIERLPAPWKAEIERLREQVQ